MDIGQRIKERRKELGLSQGEIGQRCGLSYQTVMLIENGKGATLKTLQAICEALGLELTIN